MTTCRVTVYVEKPTIALDRGERNFRHRRCGKPVERDGLCAHHLAERERLGGQR